MYKRAQNNLRIPGYDLSEVNVNKEMTWRKQAQSDSSLKIPAAVCHLCLSNNKTASTKMNIHLIYTVNIMQLHLIITFLYLNTTVRPYFICYFVLLYLSMLAICVFVFILCSLVINNV